MRCKRTSCSSSTSLSPGSSEHARGLPHTTGAVGGGGEGGGGEGEGGDGGGGDGDGGWGEGGGGGGGDEGGGLDVPVQSAPAAIGSAPTVTTAFNSLLIVHT